MGEVVNLRLARKAKAKSKSDDLAAENRAKFGMSKPEKALAKIRSQTEKKHLDGHKREAPEKS